MHRRWQIVCKRVHCQKRQHRLCGTQMVRSSHRIVNGISTDAIPQQFLPVCQTHQTTGSTIWSCKSPPIFGNTHFQNRFYLDKNSKLPRVLAVEIIPQGQNVLKQRQNPRSSVCDRSHRLLKCTYDKHRAGDDGIKWLCVVYETRVILSAGPCTNVTNRRQTVIILRFSLNSSTVPWNLWYACRLNHPKNTQSTRRKINTRLQYTVLRSISFKYSIWNLQEICAELWQTFK